MKITVKKAAQDTYALSVGDTEFALDGGQIKDLLLQITKVLFPGGDKKSAEDRTKAFMRRIKNANDVGIQKLIRVAEEDDILLLLKIAENDEALVKKFHGNMSERSRKMFTEDLIYKFKGGVPTSRIDNAIDRLTRTAKELEEEGTLIFENPAAGQAAPAASGK